MTYTQTQDGRIKIIHTEITTFVKIDSELPEGFTYILDGPKNPRLIHLSGVSDKLPVDEVFKIGERKFKQ